MLLRALLKGSNVETFCVRSSEEAASMAEQQEFALCLLDVQMPGLDGFELAGKIRLSALNHSTPIIFLTAIHLDTLSEFKGYESGAVDYIRKPYNSAILLNKVNIFLELYRQKAELAQKNRELERSLQRQRKLESSLRSCASSYEAIVEDQTELILRFDREYSILFVNQAFCRFFGVFSNGVVSEDLRNVSESLVQQFENVVRLLHQENPVSRMEGIQLNAEEEGKWIEWTIRLEEGNSGEEGLFLAVGRDVTEKKQVKEFLVKKGIMLQRAEKLANMGSWEWDSRSDKLSVSEGIYSIYEIEEGQTDRTLDLLLGKVHADDREPLERIFNHLPKENRKINLYHRIISNNGTLKYIHIEFTVEYHEQEDYFRVVGFSQDISDYKRIVMALKENLNQFLQLTNSLPQTIYEVDFNGKLTYLNQIGCSFLGCTYDMIRGGIALRDFIVAEEREYWDQLLEQLHRDKDLLVGEFTLITPNQEIRYVILYAALVMPNKGEPRARGLLLDITKRVKEEKILQENAHNYMRIISSLKETEEEISKDNLKLKQRVEKEMQHNEFQQQLLIQKSKLESLGKLATSMVHEINQPLTGISMIMDNILLRMSMNKISEEYLREKCMQVFDDIDRIKKYIQQVGLFSSTQKEEQIELFNVNQGVRNALNLIEKQYKNRGVQLKLELCSESIFVSGNRYKLEQVIVDLLSNAYESIQEKRENAKNQRNRSWIRIITDVRQGEVLIRIRDNGIGIDPENLNYIFEPFFTTKNSGIGTGLGLYITRGIIQKMRGRIEVRSRQKEFTEMSVYFPVANEKVETDQVEKQKFGKI
jgi:PAS domain S-box-containing protein